MQEKTFPAVFTSVTFSNYGFAEFKYLEIVGFKDYILFNFIKTFQVSKGSILNSVEVR